MPDTNDGPAVATTVTDAAPTTDANPLAGFAEALTMQFPPAPQAGEPKQVEAVETNETQVPEAVEEKPKVETTTASTTAEEKPAVTDTVNFDGFSDKAATFWKNALKQGHATPADVEAAREDTQFSKFQPKWTKRNQEIADRRKAFDAEMAEKREDLALLAKIRADDRLHAAWLKASKGELAEESTGDLVDDKKAEEIAKRAIEAEKARDTAARRREDEVYAKREGAIKEAVPEWIDALKVEPKVMASYLNAEEAALKGADPIARFGDDPSELFDRVQRRHEIALRDAKIAALESQVSQRASKQVQQSKASLPPARRVADARPTDAWSQAKADLGVSEDFGNVVGFGFGNGAAR